MLRLEIARTLECHRSTGMGIRRSDVAPGEAEPRQHVELGIGKCRIVETEHVTAESVAQGVPREREADVEGGGERLLEPLDGRMVEAAGGQRGMVDGRRLGGGAVAD